MSKRGRPLCDYTGRAYGLVTVVRRDGDRLWCKCQCGALRHYRHANLLTHPPKSHSKCGLGFQYELPLDNVRKQTYEEAP